MKIALSLGLVAVLATVSSLGAFEKEKVDTSSATTELKSGPQVGDEVGPYEVVKAAGNEEDGVEMGEALCYRCRTGGKPVVMIFARKSDEKLAGLLTALDKVVAENADKKLVSFVNLIGQEDEAAKKSAEKLIADSKAKHIAVVVPKDQPNGPEDYKLDPKADVTVVIYKQGTVAANHALPEGGLDKDAVKKILDDATKVLN
ncbi:MAG: hypothetical protein SGJ20_07195 [Planctomycetota bacterium]|nr:hypothetical protein [Planctomycetota bacterium]